MIIVDFDSIRNNSLGIEIVKNKIRSIIKPIPNAENKPAFSPTEAIYWFSKRPITRVSLDRLGLPVIGANFATGKKLSNYLDWMLKDIDSFSRENGMGKFSKFKNTKVYTNSDVLEIQAMGAKVIMVPKFGVN